MYPFVRMAWQLWRHRNDPDLPLGGVHVSRHVCLPWDLDPWLELNNGRTLTFFDLGRIPMSRRSGLFPLLKANGWGMTVAGSIPRYRRRIKVFDRITMKTRMIGWDARFVYTEQAIFRDDGECATHVVIRSAITSARGIVPPREALDRLGHAGPDLVLPDWVRAWTEAEAQRPWPPMQDI